MAGVLTAGRGASSVAGVAVDPDAPAQPNEIIAAANDHFNDTCGSSSIGSLGASHGVNRPAAVISGVRDVQAGAAPGGTGAERDVLPAHGTGARYSNEAAVRITAPRKSACSGLGKG
jgi:hypothetical protein